MTKVGTGTMTPAAEKLLRVASELFYREGIRAIGVDTVVDRAGVAKMTLYKNFGSKDELVAAYLRARDERWRTWLEDQVGRRASSPGDRIPAVFDALGEWMDGNEGYRGCAFVNASTEIPGTDHPAYGVISDHKKWMLGYFEELAGDAGIDSPAELAERLLILYEGAMVARTMGTGRKPIQRAREIAEALIR